MIQRRPWHPTPVPLLGKPHGWRSLVGCSPWGREESDTTEWLHFHFLLSCTGEGSGNPLQYSCLENPRDGGGWWAAVYGVAQSQTRLKRLSSSSIQQDRTECAIQKQTFPHMVHWFLKKEARATKWKKETIPTNGARATRYTYRKNLPQPSYHTIHKLRWMINLN